MSHVDVLLSNHGSVRRIGPESVQILDGVKNSTRVQGVVELEDVLPDLLINEVLVDFVSGRNCLVVDCGREKNQ